uniref:Uncharacterized protein n=1 Tax=Arundo donax TaxID=35708 RepID=A0A0A9C863_ARUDO
MTSNKTLSTTKL